MKVKRREEKSAASKTLQPLQDFESGSKAPQTGHRKNIRTPRPGKRKELGVARRMSASASLLVKLVSRNNRCCARNNHPLTLLPRKTIHEAGHYPNRAAASTMQGRQWDSRLVYACGIHDGRGCKCRGVALGWPRGWILQTRRDMT